MVLNFNMPNILPFNPGRGCLKNIGDPNLLLIINGTNIKTGRNNKALIRIGNISNVLFNKSSPSYIKYNVKYSIYKIFNGEIILIYSLLVDG